MAADQRRTRRHSAVASCAGKARFSSPQRAYAVGQKRGGSQKAYHCRHCGGWHLVNHAGEGKR